MNGPTSPVAMWRSIGDRAKKAAKDHVDKSAFELQRECVYERALARVFAEPDPHWVLKGGTALLMRVDSARHSKDIDLLHDLQDLEAAQRDLEKALSQDLGDFLRFVLPSTRTLGTDQQPGVNGRQVDVQCYCGTKMVIAFHIDLVVGSLMTAEPEIKKHAGLISVPNVAPPKIRLYPVVDHLADKLCATEAMYPGDRESSRVRDLVDIVIIAQSHELDGTALREAIEGERAHRALAPRVTLDLPTSWTEQQYRKAATSACPVDLSNANAMARALLEPAMSARVDGLVWSPDLGTWAAPAG